MFYQARLFFGSVAISTNLGYNYIEIKIKSIYFTYF